MRQFIIFIVTFFVCFVMFIACSILLEPVFENISSAANSTITNPSHLAAVNNLIFGTLQKVFGVVCVLTIIGAIVAYALDTHRFEGEEFEYYKRYR